jgi:Domain of unknown function (DUF6602)
VFGDKRTRITACYIAENTPQEKMIKTVADILNAFIEEETKKLDSYSLKHGPTIGDMYEGLSTELLNRAVPPQLGLKVVDGFVTDGDQFLSGQMDCMLVKGEGELIPYTNSYKWHVKDVLLVFEVKKNLYSADLINSFLKLRQVAEGYGKYLFDGKHEENTTFNLSPSFKTFSQLTGITAPSYKDREQLSKENELIYTTLFMEQLTPVRVVLGYDGFKSEYGLREGLIKYIEEVGSGQGFGVPSFPQLIICKNYSLVKANGRPYVVPMREGYWDFMMSSKANPVLLLLEFIWTKLSLEFDVGMPWGDDTEQEKLNEFLRAKPVEKSGQLGWMYKYDELSKKTLEARESTFSWEPIEITSSQYVIFTKLAKENIDISDPEFISFAEESGSRDMFVQSILDTNLVSLDGANLKLISDDVVVAVIPDGRFLVAENNSGRFEKWLDRLMAEFKTKK